MARKPAPTKAKKPKASPDAKASALAPAPAIEPKPDRFSNPLVTAAAIHPDLKPLLDAVVMVSVSSQEIARCYPDLLALMESQGPPKADDWPDSPGLERDRAQHAEWAKAVQEECAVTGESVIAEGFVEPCWTAMMRRWSACYLGWCTAIANARELMRSAAVRAIMDAGESRPAHRWTTQTIIDLDNLAGTLHPIRMGGVDGLGFIRCGLPPLPQDFRTHAEAVGNRIGELRSIPVLAVPPTPTVSVSPDLLDPLQRAAAAVDPQAIDRAASGHTRMLPTGDDGQYRPATWFPKGMADRLRQAASKSRKSKRVRAKKVDGVVLYNLEDVRRWWPNGLPEDP